MSFRAAREARERRAAGEPLRLTFARRDWSAAEDGAPLDGRGFLLLDGDRPLPWTSPRLAAAGIEVIRVAGTSYRLDALQDSGFAPGSPLVLRAEPENPHDPNAVGVWEAGAGAQAGYVPREQAADLAPRLAGLEAYALWEWRDEDDRRCGLRILVAPRDSLSELPRPLRD